jgi:phospholipid/cholesterol/gamma-HCH transport system permease protein
LDLGGLEFLDSAGALAILELAERIKSQGVGCSLDNVPARIQSILELINIKALTLADRSGEGKKTHFISLVGDGFLEFIRDMKAVVSFTGEITINLAVTFFNPRRVRWSDVILYMKKVGVEGLPIISLIALLLGLILAFMSSLQLKQFGANIYVASLLAISMVRELGPIMTAIVVAGRSGSAFAAEIGTMKVNEEVDALTVMGMEPMYFLALPKVIATIIVVPLLTIYADLLGMIGGLIVGVTMLDLTVYSYIQETKWILTVFDFTSSFVKTLVFAFVISVIGCQRGFQVRGGAAAVGAATTSAVVAAIFMIIVVDSVFAVVLTYIPR